MAGAEFVDPAPVRVGHAEPLAVAGPDVDVDGAEVVVLLVAGRAAAGDLERMVIFIIFIYMGTFVTARDKSGRLGVRGAL